MRFLSYLLLFAIVFAGCTTTKKAPLQPHQPAQNKIPDTKKEKVAEITFDNPVIDFGKVVKGETRTHDFTFTNTGNAPLIIEIATGCSCTTIDYPTHPIPPGKKGNIHIVFDSTNKKPGALSVDIDVIANTKPIVTTAMFNAEVIAKK